MANGWYRAQVTIPMDSGIPADSVVNTWAFRNFGSADHATDGGSIRTRLDAFYSAVSGFYSSRCNLAAATCKVFDYAESQPRIPFYESTMSVSADTTTWQDLPAEVAVCLSFTAPRVSGTNSRRRRGRVYLGPLKTMSDVSDLYNVLGTMASDIADAADTHILSANDDIEWCVFSPYTLHDVPVGGDIKDYPDEDPSKLLLAWQVVTQLWTDNAWDTQRRRGTAATTRYIRS